MKKKKELKNYNKTHNVVVYNDPLHSLEFVTKVLIEVFQMTEDEAIKHAYLIHTQQKAIVYSGFEEHSEHFIDMIDRFPAEEKDGKLFPSLASELRRNIKN